MAEVLFDLRMWDWTGVGRYSTNLFAALNDLRNEEKGEVSYRAVLNSKEEISSRLSRMIEERSIEVVEVKVKPFSFFNFYGSNLSFLARSDLFHVPHFTLPKGLKLPTVATIHDLIPLRYPVMSWWKKKIYFEWNKRSLFEASRIIAVSNFTADLIHRLFPIPFEKVVVVYEAPDPIFYSEECVGKSELTEEPYFLAFANWRYHKGLDVLLKGFSAASVQANLILVGQEPKVGEVSKGLLKLVERLLKEGRLVFSGRVDDEQLVKLYCATLAFIHPSREEGFGLPPLEAMAAGAPVISADIPVSKEVLSEAAIYYTVEDYQELCFTLEKVEKDLILRKEYASRGRERAKSFSWKKAARETTEVYKQVLGFT